MSILYHLYLNKFRGIESALSLLRNQISVWLLENGTDRRWALSYSNEALYWQQESVHQHHVTMWHDGKCNQDLLCNSHSSAGSLFVPVLASVMLIVRTAGWSKTLVFILIVTFWRLCWSTAAEWMQRKHWDTPRTLLQLAASCVFQSKYICSKIKCPIVLKL